MGLSHVDDSVAMDINLAHGRPKSTQINVSCRRKYYGGYKNYD